MILTARFDTKNNTENITIESMGESTCFLGANLINFISLDMETILNERIIASLSENNCKEVITRINKVIDFIIPELIHADVLIDSSNMDIQLIDAIKKDLKEVLKTYNKFKELVEFCYFNDSIKDMAPLQRYIYYLHKFEIEKVILPRQTVSSFGLIPKKTSKKILKDANVFEMLKSNSPFFYFGYECSSIEEYMTITFFKIIENNYIILKCKNCGKYFIPYNRADTLYCDRVSPQDALKTCKKYGGELAWREKTKDETDWRCLYRRVYQSLQMKAKRNKGHKESEQKFENFKEEAKKWKKEVKEHTKTEKEFLKWLQGFRTK